MPVQVTKRVWEAVSKTNNFIGFIKAETKQEAQDKANKVGVKLSQKSFKAHFEA